MNKKERDNYLIDLEEFNCESNGLIEDVNNKVIEYQWRYFSKNIAYTLYLNKSEEFNFGLKQMEPSIKVSLSSNETVLFLEVLLGSHDRGNEEYADQMREVFRGTTT
jgi:hypothetical protein